MPAGFVDRVLEYFRVKCIPGAVAVDAGGRADLVQGVCRAHMVADADGKRCTTTDLEDCVSIPKRQRARLLPEACRSVSCCAALHDKGLALQAFRLSADP